MKCVNNKTSRRKFLATSIAATSGILLASQTGLSAPAILKRFNKPNSLINGVQIGTITYSFRSMPDQSAEATLQYILDSGIGAVELMGDPAETFAGRPVNKIDRRKMWGLMRSARENTLTDDQKKEYNEMRAEMNAYNKEVAEWRGTVSMDKFKQVKEMYNDKGVEIYAFKPRAFGRDNSDVEIDYGFRAAKALGASHVTLEHPSDDEWTAKLGGMAAKHKMYVGYHGHEQQTPTFWDTALEQSKYNALNIDIGHYIAAGNDDPLGILRSKHHRIKSMHMKDRQTPANGKGNLPWGTGDTPLTDVLQLMRNNKYKFPATIELEYQIPEGSNAVKEVQMCLEYCRKALS